jgi:hypothetical protein
MKVRVAVVDSGINPDHPHVGQVTGGIFFQKGIASEDFVDRLGHGTAVGSVIHEKAPAAEIYAVRIFNRRLSTDIDTLISGLDWCLANGMHVVNLSVGTTNQLHRPRLEDFLRRTQAQNVFLVSAAAMLPGMLDGAIGVEADPECDRDTIRFQNGTFLASPYPRSIPGVPKELNLQGISFAIANCSGLLAKLLESHTPVDAYREFRARAGR